MGLAACASTPLPSVLPRTGPPVELSATPFFPQLDHQCGPAALATVLVADGVAVTPEQLSARIYLPGRQGSLQTELIAATRAYERVAVNLGGGIPQLLASLREGRPVLVLLDLARIGRPAWHYAVVVGYEPESARFILRSGREQRATMAADRFLRAWSASRQWAFVVASLDTPPKVVSAPQWIAAVAPLESLRQFDAAERGYRAASLRWPGVALPWTALGNVHAQQQQWREAVADYSRALQLDDNVVLRNNRAEALGALQCVARANNDLARAEALDVEQRYRAALAQTRAGLPAIEACAVDEAIERP